MTCVVSEGDSPLRIVWLKDGDPLNKGEVDTHQSGEFDLALKIHSASPAHNGNYTCVASNDAANTSRTERLQVHGTNVGVLLLPPNNFHLDIISPIQKSLINYHSDKKTLSGLNFTPNFPTFIVPNKISSRFEKSLLKYFILLKISQLSQIYCVGIIEFIICKKIVFYFTFFIKVKPV